MSQNAPMIPQISFPSNIPSANNFSRSKSLDISPSLPPPVNQQTHFINQAHQTKATLSDYNLYNLQSNNLQYPMASSTAASNSMISSRNSISNSFNINLPSHFVNPLDYNYEMCQNNHSQFIQQASPPIGSCHQHHNHHQQQQQVSYIGYNATTGTSSLYGQSLGVPSQQIETYHNASNSHDHPISPLTDSESSNSNQKKGTNNSENPAQISESILSSAIAIAEASVAAEAGHKSRKRRKRADSTNSENKNTDDNQLFPCDKCDKVFNRPYNLKSHQRTHSTEKPHPCKICGRAFARAHDRRRHENLHKGEKKFRCSGFLNDGTTRWGCERRFARADALGRHFRTETGWLCIRPLMEEAKELEKSMKDINIDDYQLDNSDLIRKLMS